MKKFDSEEEFQQYRKFVQIFSTSVIDVVTSPSFTNQNGEEYDRLVFDLIKQRGGFDFAQNRKEQPQPPHIQEVIDGIRKVSQEIGNDKEKALQFLKDAGILDIINEQPKSQSIEDKAEIAADKYEWDFESPEGNGYTDFKLGFTEGYNQTIIDIENWVQQNNLNGTVDTIQLFKQLSKLTE